MNGISAWKIVEGYHYQTGKDCVEALLKSGYRVSEWVQDIFSDARHDSQPISVPISLSRVSVSSLGLNAPTALSDIYNKIEECGYGLVSPEIAIYCRFIYDEQPTGEWLRYATPLNSMIDSDGVPHLPKLGKALGLYFLETYWAYEGAIFHPHNEFVVTTPD